MDNLLEISNMTKQVDQFRLENINIKLEPGYIMGLIGPNGSGKTTLILTLLGLYKPQEGYIRICGYDIDAEEKKAKSIMGFVLAENPFPENVSSRTNGKLYGTYYPEWDGVVFERYLRQFEVDPKKPLKKLSKGNRMKFQLAFALSHNAKLLVFDEPTSGLDPVFRRELMEIMCDVISDGERSILYSTHLTSELDKVADYITLIQNGKQQFSLSKEELMQRYCLVRGDKKEMIGLDQGIVIGKRITDNYAEALVRRDLVSLPEKLLLERPTLEDIFYYSVQAL